jgi:Ca-activated chloride channel family protein
VGITNQGDLVNLIQEKAKSRVFLSVFGFGMGNYKDSTLELLADKGNGAYGYIDTRREAEKVFVEQAEGTLATIAKDVKIQVEFNPARVQSYRLIGYENRLLKKEDFNNDAVDAGEIGAGHTVTALYEVVPVGVDADGMPRPEVDPLKYQKSESDVKTRSVHGVSPELLTVKVRYKAPEGDVSRKLEFPLVDAGADFAKADGDFQFAAAVAGWGMLLRDSPHKGTATFPQVLNWAENGLGDDAGGYRAEFIQLVRRSMELSER